MAYETQVGTGEIISPEKAADLYLAEHPLPLAEGATAEEFLKGCEHDGSFIPVHEVIRLMNAFAASQKQQPTAEGAEEIDDETIAYAAEYQCGTPFSERWIGFVKGAKWHRSLHAQQIADKMVEERLRGKFLLAYDELRDLCCRFFRHWWNSPGANAEQGFDTWAEKNNLKSREK